MVRKITTTSMPFITANIDDINILDGVTSTTEEINYLDITNLENLKTVRYLHKMIMVKLLEN